MCLSAIEIINNMKLMLFISVDSIVCLHCNLNITILILGVKPFLCTRRKATYIMKILIVADMVPTEPNYTLFQEGKVNDLIGEKLVNLFQNADFRIANLELPLVNKHSPIHKCGPNLMAPTDTVKAYQELHVDLVTIANNHIMDQGIEGLRSTCSVLDSVGIAHVGAGDSLQEALKPFIFQMYGKHIGVYACTEHEFSTAAENHPGANPFDPYESFDHIAMLKEICDCVIVLYHGGKEYYRYPSPNLQKTCRKFVDKGANVVLCQHSHCIGCKEEYQNGVIVYGQGNFLFAKREDEFWNSGMLIEIEIGESVNVSFFPVVKRSEKVRIASKKETEEIMSSFQRRSQEILEKDFVETHYIEFANSMRQHYLDLLSGNKYSLVLYKLLSKTGKQKVDLLLQRKLYQEENILAIINAIECEAHREVLLRGLKSCVKNK